MKFRGLSAVLLGGMLIAACSSGTEGSEPGVAKTDQAIIGPSTNGGLDAVVMLYAKVSNPDGSQSPRTCSGSYLAPRVVLTAAHCLENLVPSQVFIYFGDHFATDLAQLVPGPNGLTPPAPGKPSFFAQADSFEAHPNFDPTQFYPDLGVVYLDRKLPFDPLPILRTPLAANRQVTISGWGANSAPTPTTGAGAQVQRSGSTRTLGSPTLADNHPEDPNPGLNSAANRATLIKIDGTPPNANACFGDSGGPILVTDRGQTYVAGVSYFGGLSCANYALYVRTSSFLPFLDQAYQKGGQSTVTPAFDCVAPNAQGTLTAFFGYDNKNGVNVTVPFGVKNFLSRDSGNTRPSLFVHGQHDFTFGVDFSPSQTVSWTLAAENSPATTLLVNRNSRRCGAAEANQTECALACRASERSGCANLPSFADCVTNCLGNIEFFQEIFPACLPQNSAFDACAAEEPPGAPNWQCDDLGGAFPATCGAQSDAINACLSQ